MPKKVIGIIGAMDIEVQEILKLMDIKAECEISSQVMYVGFIEGVSCVVSRCFPGKVNSAVCAQTMILEYHPDIIINIGVAGGIGNEIKVGDLVIATACVQHDFDTTACGDVLATIQNLGMRDIPCDPTAVELLTRKAKEIYPNVHRGVVATGDIFVADPARNAELAKKFNAIACEMEGGSIAHVCTMNQVPFAVVRAISDNANSEAAVSFETFMLDSAKKCQDLMQNVVQSL